MSSSLLTNKYTCSAGTEQRAFLSRNKVANSYKGAVFAVEDVWVPCSLCRTPVDPVQRIPVGNMWFHPHCLRCAICQQPSRTNVFHAVEHQPVCADCLTRGFGSTVKRSVSRSPRRELTLMPPSRSALMSRGSAASSRAALCSRGTDMMGGPLSVTKDPRATTRRGLELVERQEALARNDGNILLLMQSPSPSKPHQ